MDPITGNSSTLARTLNFSVGDSDPHIEYYPGRVSCQQADLNDTATYCVDAWWLEAIDGAFRGAVSSVSCETRTCSLRLSFQGLSIEVWGVRSHDGASALVSIDGGEPALANFTSTDGTRQLNQTVFSSGQLDADTSHTLTLWYDPASWVGPIGSWVRVDKFVIQIPDTLSSPFPSSEVGSTIVVVPGHDITTPTPSTGTVMGNPTLRFSTGSGTSATDKPIAIAGHNDQVSDVRLAVTVGMGTGGGILLVLLLALVWRRRRHRAAQAAAMRRRVFANMTAAFGSSSSTGNFRESCIAIEDRPSAFILSASTAGARIHVPEPWGTRDDKFRAVAGDKAAEGTTVTLQPSLLSTLPPSYHS